MDLTITQVLDDLRTADEIVRRFERRYWLSSADFFTLYQQGLLDDGGRTEDYALWAGFHLINVDREAALGTLSTQRVRQLRGQTLALDPREPVLKAGPGAGFLNRAEYETVIGALPKAFPAITKTTLRMRNSGAPTAIVDGELFFPSGLRLRIIEAIDYKAGRIQAYAYTLWRGENKLGWFDSTPLTGEPHLAENFPHHYHDLSTGDEQRASAPALSFTHPNLPAVINFCLLLDQPPVSPVSRVATGPLPPMVVAPPQAPPSKSTTGALHLPVAAQSNGNGHGHDHALDQDVIVEQDAPQPLAPDPTPQPPPDPA